MLEVRNISKSFGGFWAINQVNLDVKNGEVVAVIGPNGAGKSTLFNLITGLFKPSSGAVHFAGAEITGLPAHRIAGYGIARTFQLTHLFPQLTARENVRIAAQARDKGRWQLLGGGGVLGRTAALADEALERMRLSPLADRPAALLSHGDQRLLEVAMAIAQRPRLIMLDEPTQGLSIEETDHAVDNLKAALAGGELTMILVEHDMEVVFRLADNITVLHRGHVIADGPAAAVRADPVVQRAYLGGAE